MKADGILPLSLQCLQIHNDHVFACMSMQLLNEGERWMICIFDVFWWIKCEFISELSYINFVIGSCFSNTSSSTSGASGFAFSQSPTNPMKNTTKTSYRSIPYARPQTSLMYGHITISTTLITSSCKATANKTRTISLTQLPRQGQVAKSELLRVLQEGH